MDFGPQDKFENNSKEKYSEKWKIATVRKAAKQFGVSKSTAHKDVTTRLLEIDPQLAAKVRKILDINKQERHIRGGLATKEKYSHMTR